jgi:hypothetical protein
MRGENFIYFATVSGFFIGIIFSILNDLSIEGFLFATIIITLLFYLIALGSVAFYIKFVEVKRVAYLDKREIDMILDSQIKELEKKEDFIIESYEFIRQIEQEELEIIKKSRK